MINFPSSPTVGQKYPQPSVVGVPVYTWDGEKWTTVGGSLGGKSPVWTDGTAAMTGALVLPADPTANLQASTKQYADGKLAKAGGTLTGPLILAADPATALGSATKQYADGKLSTAGGTLTGPLILAADPATALGSATKQYADAKVARSGDTMTGQLGATSFVSGTPATNTGTYYFGTNGVQNLTFSAGNYVLNGGQLVLPTGGVTLNGWAGVATNGVIFMGNVGSNYLFFDGTSSANLWTFHGGNVNVPGTLTSGGAFTCNGNINSTSGIVYLNSAITAYVYYNGANLMFQCPSAALLTVVSTGRVQLSGGLSTKAGFNGAFNSYSFTCNWDTAHYNIFVDTTYIGDMAITSDYRTKANVLPLSDMWETVKALRPISYTTKKFSPPSHVKHMAAQREHLKKLRDDGYQKEADEFLMPGELFEKNDAERWGFVAHELQETLVQTAATSYKDAPDAVQSPNALTVIAALTKALQEAMARIEALEAK
jgi:hypothetical protein